MAVKTATGRDKVEGGARLTVCGPRCVCVWPPCACVWAVVCLCVGWGVSVCGPGCACVQLCVLCCYTAGVSLRRRVSNSF